MMKNENIKINPNYISGLVQSDGSFFDSISVLEKIRIYFNCGYISTNKKNNSAEFVVSSIKDLKYLIIPHFYNYPLHLSKQSSFIILENIINILNEKAHYDKNIFANVIKLAFSMNEVNNRTMDQQNKLLEFIGINNSVEQPIKPEIINHTLNEEFLIGFIDGDSSFHISFKKNKKLQLGFHITQHNNSIELLKKVNILLGCGTIKEKSITEIRYQFEHINTILIPFINKYKLHTNKAIHY